MTARIQIVGIGDDGLDGLTGQARQLIDQAAVLVGPSALLDKMPNSEAERVVVGSNLEQLQAAIRELGDSSAVVLASGDPLFYGIARYLTETFGKDRFEVIPHVSSMQLAFARVKESWDDAYLTNLATQPLDRVVDHIRTAELVGLFTTSAITPSVVAEALLDRRIDYFTAYICENLGTPDETVTQGDLQSIRNQTFGSMNVMVLVRRHGAADRPSGSERRRLFGNPDDLFLQSRPKRGLLTPSEVRCIALAELDLTKTSVVWDVGAGSGSLAIEAAAIANEGQVYAIEMDAEDYALMIENAKMFVVPSLVPVHGQAPAAWQELPRPDAIFVGGSGRVVPDLVAEAIQHLAPTGRIVVNVSSPDNLVAVQQVFGQAGLHHDVRMINIARGQYQLDRVRFASLNPTFLVLGWR
ncbi:precorrin-6y C5,15-methyltransferase (decarboxylating) subunit CbiE [Novipirellula artificiosorum]|uniref:Precorrin-6Y C(5,15)-methyltransferase [decarboxylating] n=1 Tax=Novipirellula artificiosorum TaxID=2528016 RepID=A0A5C6D0W4_9BACT|nr:precorrin-6y C5,15-methyltransferase (decarboxylating) subunit CbiE [Novipirellula artificiosorum]TWU30552.1 Precorrin-6Y C(5,15)-methyltransferase [decarboxylating] [Novipirellula artificiosorum]